MKLLIWLDIPAFSFDHDNNSPKARYRTLNESSMSATEASINLLHSGSAEEFVAALKTEINDHSALSHPLLEQLAAGRFPDTRAVLRDYAHQYSFYSQWFTQYLEGAISTLDNPEHVALLMENMEEEKGIPGSSDKAALPHVEIYQLFKHEVGATREYCQANPPCTTVLLWRDLFLQKCSSRIKGVGVAAIGLATEGIISTIYPYIIKAIKEHTDLGEDASLFFDLHVDCDDGHSEAVEQIIIDLAGDPGTREAIRFGVFSSLNLRQAFWDAQLARANAV